MGSNNRSILHTLLYSDIFEYPLSKEELWRFLISVNNKILQKSELEKMLQKNKSLIQRYNKFYYLKGRKHIVRLRQQRQKESLKKLKIAKRVSRVMKFLPTIKLIGISGSLSMLNAKKEDDIDLFIICSSNTIWFTRLFIIALLQLLGIRRKRNDVISPNKICVNMLITQDNLLLLKQNIYTAHEVVQMRVLFQKNNMHQKFLFTNKWVLHYLPNAFILKNGNNNNEIKKRKKNSLIDYLAKKIQMWYMKDHITTETISSSILAFHPHNNENWILKEYNRRIKEYV